MSDTQYEYSFGDYQPNTMGQDIWCGQSFTIGTVGANVSHNITSIKLNLAKVDGSNVGTVTIGIRTSLTGTDLCAGTCADAQVPVTPSALIEFTLSPTTVTLNASTLYYWVVRAPSASASNALRLFCSNGSIYAGGAQYFSYDSGATWGSAGANDNDFYEYGKPAGGWAGKPWQLNEIFTELG